VHPTRRLTLLFFWLLGAVCPIGAAQGAAPVRKTPEVRSEAVLVLDQATESVIFARREDRAAPIASITKLMTALVVLDIGQPLDEQIEITAADRSRTGGEASRLAVGTQLTRRELLQLALMSSENRAAQALCRAYRGGESACIAAMNVRARQLGMTQAHFEDPTGLSSRNVASPQGLARLVVAANQNPVIRKFSTTPSWSVRIGRKMVEFHNTDPLVKDPGWRVSVQKTGHIAAAGRCLVLQALVDGRDVVIVLLNSVGKYTRVADARRIRSWLAAIRLATADAVQDPRDS
jgi:serine-type D-Ala-D-Ala endopeptidase (penicillin-binding protein 7)